MLACLLALGAVNQRICVAALVSLVTLVFWLRRHQAPAVQFLTPVIYPPVDQKVGLHLLKMSKSDTESRDVLVSVGRAG